MTSESSIPVRDYAAAFLVGAVAALIIDAVMQLTLDAVRVSGYGGGAPWWITANVIARGRWVALAALLWWLAPHLIAQDAHEPANHPTPEVWRRVGVAVIGLPLLWVLATWMVTAIRFTLLGSWATDGRVFLAPEYYRGIAVEYVPWLMAGLAVLAIRRHL